MSSTEEIIKDLQSVKFGLGLMTLTMNIQNPVPDDVAFATLTASIERNLPNKTFFNGGEFYGPDNVNLKLVQRFFAKYPEQRKNVIISIKGCFDMAVTFAPKGSREGVQQSIDNVTSYIPEVDIFEPARIDPEVPIEETIEALNANVDSGKIKSIGLSEVGAVTLEKISQISKHKITSLEVEFSIFSREILENGTAAKAGELGVTLIAYSPLARGLLTGKIKKGSDIAANDYRRTTERFEDENIAKNNFIVEQIEGFAAKKGVSIVEFSLAWVRYWSEKTINGVKFPKIIDIPSVSSPKRVKENLSDVVLTEEEFNKVNEFLDSVSVSGARYGARFEKYLDA